MTLIQTLKIVIFKNRMIFKTPACLMMKLLFFHSSFDPNPTLRLNFWGLIFGNALSGMSTSGHRQEGYQRYAAMPTMKKARL